MYRKLAIEVEKMIRIGEGGTVEFKQFFPNDDLKWLKTAVAFSNGIGGHILFGVDDSKNPVGIPESEVEDTLEHISKNLNEMVVPQISHEEVVVNLNDVLVISVTIGPGAMKPYRIRNGDVYIRSGRSTLKACDEAIVELELSSKGRSVDRLPFIDYSGMIPEPTEKEIRYLKDKMASAGIDDYSESKMVSQGLLIESADGYRVTRAFDLLTKNTGCFEVNCALFPNNKAIDFLDRAVYGGPIIEQIQSACIFVMRNIRCSGTVSGIERKDVYDLPIEAVREAITNAVVHRNYLLTGAAVYVSIFPDRVEIESPGMMAVPVNRMKSGACLRRNPAIAQFLRDAKLMESWGSGYRRMCEACSALGIGCPLIEEIEDRVRVTLYRLDDPLTDAPKVPVMNSMELRMLELMLADPLIKKKDIARALGISDPYVSKLIRIAKDRNVLTRNENVRTGGWIVDESLMKRTMR